MRRNGPVLLILTPLGRQRRDGGCISLRSAVNWASVLNGGQLVGVAADLGAAGAGEEVEVAAGVGLLDVLGVEPGPAAGRDGGRRGPRGAAGAHAVGREEGGVGCVGELGGG